MRIFVTGGTGFIGRALLPKLRSAGFSVRLALRRNVRQPVASGVEAVDVGEINAATEWAKALEGVDAVVHLAARAHVLRDDAPDPEAAYLATNYEGTLRLADACRGRVGRFVFLSSIGVYGSAKQGETLHEESALSPDTEYGRSKAGADLYLQELTRRGDLNCVVLRPPLVYGSGAPGNLARLSRLVQRGIPLPFGAVKNRRSLVGREHLARAIRAVLEAGQLHRPVYCIADREVVSTPDIVRALARGHGKKAWLMHTPTGLLRAGGRVAKRRRTVEQLVGSLEVNSTAFRTEVGDFQPCSTIEGLQRTTAAG